jgi:hypothetical protein
MQTTTTASSVLTKRVIGKEARRATPFPPLHVGSFCDRMCGRDLAVSA